MLMFGVLSHWANQRTKRTGNMKGTFSYEVSSSIPQALVIHYSLYLLTLNAIRYTRSRKGNTERLLCEWVISYAAVWQ